MDTHVVSSYIHEILLTSISFHFSDENENVNEHLETKPPVSE